MAEALLDLDFSAGDRIVLTGLVLAGERPVPGITVSLSEASGRPYFVGGLTDYQGRFRLEALAPGRYLLTAREARGTELYNREIELADDREIALHIERSTE